MCAVNETFIMAQTDLLVSKELKDAGYEYVIVDGTSLEASFSAFTNTNPPDFTNPKAMLQGKFLWKLCSTNGEQSLALSGTFL